MTMLLLLVIILALVLFLAAMTTFLLLEHKDEHTLNTIAVTPVGTSGYLKFKIAYIYLMSVIGNIVILFGNKADCRRQIHDIEASLFDNINIFHIVSFALSPACLLRPWPAARRSC